MNDMIDKDEIMILLDNVVSDIREAYGEDSDSFEYATRLFDRVTYLLSKGSGLNE